jgi:hypothetical protein
MLLTKVKSCHNIDEQTKDITILPTSNMSGTMSEEAHTITAADGTEVEVPENFICPITQDIMSCPLLSREGHNYEREAIMNWVSEHGTSPLTREFLRPSQLVRNRVLEGKISRFLRQHGIDDTTVEAKSEEFKFVGYVPFSACKKDGSLAIQSHAMNLNGLVASTIEANMSSSTPSVRQAELLSEHHLWERRRQIADMITGAMQDLDGF